MCRYNTASGGIRLSLFEKSYFHLKNWFVALIFYSQSEITVHNLKLWENSTETYYLSPQLEFYWPPNAVIQFIELLVQIIISILIIQLACSYIIQRSGSTFWQGILENYSKGLPFFSLFDIVQKFGLKMWFLKICFHFRRGNFLFPLLDLPLVSHVTILDDPHLKYDGMLVSSSISSTLTVERVITVRITLPIWELSTLTASLCVSCQQYADTWY